MITSKRHFAAFGTVLLWGSAFPAIKLAEPELGPGGLTTFRLLIGAVALLVVSPLFGARLPQRRDVFRLSVTATLGMAGYQALLNFGEVNASAGFAGLVLAGTPIVSMIFAMLLKRERLGRLQVVGILISAFGTAALFLNNEGHASLTATVLLGLAAVAYALYHPLVKPLLERYTGFEVALYGLLGGALESLVFLPLSLPRLPEVSGASWLAVIYLGLGPSAAAFVLWGYALRRMPAWMTTSYLFLLTPMAIVLSVIFLGESVKPSEVIGGLLVLAGSATARVFYRGWSGREPRHELEHTTVARHLINSQSRSRPRDRP